MTKIHPTAIVSPEAKIDYDVEIGPYSIIEDDVEIDSETRIGAYCIIHSGTRIGKKNQIFSYTNLGGLPQDISFNEKIKTYLRIGDNNIIREYVNIHRATKEEQATIIGNKNYIMGSVHIGHDCILEDEVILTHNAIIAGHVKIEKKAFVSGHVAVHQFCSIGAYSITGGLSKVVQDVPPFFMADGNPAKVVGINIVGLRRAGFSEERRRNIKKAYQILYRSRVSINKALEELKKLENINEDIQHLINFISSSRRGILGGNGVEKDES